MKPVRTEDDPSRIAKFANSKLAHSVKAQKAVLIVPDKDADGLSAGAILRHTLLLLGVKPDLIDVHTLAKGKTIHSEDERRKMAARSPAYVFVIDQGSRRGPAIIDGQHTGLVIDHHHATEDDFPAGSEHVRSEGEFCNHSHDC